jgi:hypothetical protein
MKKFLIVLDLFVIIALTVTVLSLVVRFVQTGDPQNVWNAISVLTLLSVLYIKLLLESK